MKQADAFQKGEGDVWYARNSETLASNLEKIDPVIELIKKHVSKPKFVYEVGCSNGWRLRRIMDEIGCKAGGCDPSRYAINQASFSGVSNVYYGIATKLHGAEGCDVLIYGFCLYLCDPEDYFKIVMEGDRVLKDDGYLIIHDFYMLGTYPHRIPYKHKEGLFSHHVAWENLWLAHPWYHFLEQRVQDGKMSTILKKDSSKAWGIE